MKAIMMNKICDKSTFNIMLHRNLYSPICILHFHELSIEILSNKTKIEESIEILKKIKIDVTLFYAKKQHIGESASLLIVNRAIIQNNHVCCNSRNTDGLLCSVCNCIRFNELSQF